MQSAPADSPASDGPSAEGDWTDRFFAECGGSAPFQIAVEQNGCTQRVSFSRPHVLVGRDERCDIRLLHPEVSRRHAYLQLLDGRFYCADLVSRAGLRWGGRQQKEGWLEPGETVAVGPCSIRLEEFSAGRGAPVGVDDNLSGEAGDAPANVALEFQSTVSDSRVWPVSREVTLVGSDPGCKVHLAHPTVAKVHCSLVRTAFGLWVVDLQGGGSTRVDGESIGAARLDEGQLLEIGRFRAQVRYSAPETSIVRGRDESSGESTAGDKLSDEFPKALAAQFARLRGEMQKQMDKSLEQLVRNLIDAHPEQAQQLREEFRLLGFDVREQT